MYKQLHIKTLSFFILLSILFFSCGEDNPIVSNEDPFGFAYYPVELGNYWVYQVDSTIYDDGGATILNSSTFIKEEIVDFYLNESDDTIYVLNRSQASSLNGTFITRDAWSIEMNEFRVTKTEENLRFIKLVFPITVDRVWQGNQFDELIKVDVVGEKLQVYKDWGDYRIINDSLSLNVNGTQYDNVVEVLQGDASNDIERRFAKEYFGKGVGLIKKEMIILDSQCDCPGESWEEKAEAGFILTQTLVEYN